MSCWEPGSDPDAGAVECLRSSRTSGYPDAGSALIAVIRPMSRCVGCSSFRKDKETIDGFGKTKRPSTESWVSERQVVQ